MRNVLLFILLITTLPATAEDRSAPVTVVGRIPWDGHYAARTVLPGGSLDTALQGSGGGNEFTDVLMLDYSGKEAAQIPLFTLSGSPLKTGNGNDIRAVPEREDTPGTGTITSSYYMLMGQVRYENVAPGSYLEMWSCFGAARYFSRTLADSGPMEALGGSSDWRPFWIPFDSSGTKDSLSRIEVNLHLNGSGKVWLRDIVLGEVPFPVWLPQMTPNALPAATSPPAHPPRTDRIDWKSFWLGVAATGAFLLAGGGIVAISRRWNQRRHERELRRIASLDS